MIAAMAAAVSATSTLRFASGCCVLGLAGAGELFAVGGGGDGRGDGTAGASSGAVTSATGFSIAGAVERTIAAVCFPRGRVLPTQRTSRQGREAPKRNDSPSPHAEHSKPTRRPTTRSFSPGSGLSSPRPSGRLHGPRVRGADGFLEAVLAVKRDAGPSHPIESRSAGRRTCDNNALLWQPACAP